MQKQLVLVKYDEHGNIQAIVIKENQCVKVYKCEIAGWEELEDLLK